MPKTEPNAVDLKDVAALIRVVETGSIAQAAMQLGVAKSIVSRRISRLETILEARLLTRTSRGTALTDAGEDYYKRAARGLLELEAAREAVTRSATQISGQLRVSIPQTFGEFCLGSLLADFAALHPRIEFDVIFEDRQPDMIAEGLDLAIRVGELPDSSFVTRKLASVRWAIVASPTYLDARGRPSKPADLATHDAVLYKYGNANWRLKGADGWENVRINQRLTTNNGYMLLVGAQAGLGIVVLPVFMVQEALDRGALEYVLPAFTHEGADLHMLMPPARAGIARVRALVNFLDKKMRRTI